MVNWSRYNLEMQGIRGTSFVHSTENLVYFLQTGDIGTRKRTSRFSVGTIEGRTV